MSARTRRTLGTAAAALTLTTAIAGHTGAATATPDPGPTADAGDRWTTAWAAAPQPPNPGRPWLGPNWSPDGFADQSVRQVVRVSAGGRSLRVRLSNLYGERPLRIAGATITESDSGAALRPGTVRRITFRHRAAVTIPTGAHVASDEVRLATRPLQRLAVTLYLADATGPATFHELGLTTTYPAAGDQRLDTPGGPFSETSQAWYYLTGIDVAGGRRADRPAGTIVTFGDSITDGAILTPNADNRYPDQLAEAFAAAGTRVGVAYAGVNGNRVVHDSTCYGESGITRFHRDALGQPGVHTVVVLLGINDIIHPFGGTDPDCETPPVVTAAQIIDGHRSMIRAAHARGVRVVGATLLPFKGNPLHSEATATIRDEVNDWIRTSGEYDAVVDLARALADPADPEALRPEYAAFDHLHPNDAGMTAIAQAIEPLVHPAPVATR
jgi:lysophospholipase L1-like esterase